MFDTGFSVLDAFGFYHPHVAVYPASSTEYLSAKCNQQECFGMTC
jgi:hypothetical protein